MSQTVNPFSLAPLKALTALELTKRIEQEIETRPNAPLHRFPLYAVLCRQISAQIVQNNPTLAEALAGIFSNDKKRIDHLSYNGTIRSVLPAPSQG